jgi:O-antigen/teichoic acid export membrane protein
VVALATMRPVGASLIRLDRPLVITSASLVAVGCNVGLNLALIPRFGIVGAGIASSVAYGLLVSFYVTWLSRAVGLSARELLPRVADVRDPLAALLSYRPGWLARMMRIG